MNLSESDIVLALRRCQAATRDYLTAVYRFGGEWTAEKAERATYATAFRELTGREATQDELDTMTGVKQEATP